jgi:hypothetical protein
MLVLTGCKYDRGLILFNTEPINQYNVTHDKKVFNTDSRVYYIFIAPKKMKGGFIRVQIFKMTDKAPWGGNEVVRTKDYRLMKDERYYHTNYFVLHEKGRYVLQVFSHDDLLTPLAVNYFYVE